MTRPSYYESSSTSSSEDENADEDAITHAARGDARPSPSSEPAASDDRDQGEGEDRGTLVDNAIPPETLSQAPPTLAINSCAIHNAQTPSSVRTPRRKLPSVPPTPNCSINHHTPQQTSLLYDELAALKLVLSELQVCVAANTSAIGAMSAPHVEDSTADVCAERNVGVEGYVQAPFTFPKRTVNAHPPRTSTPPPITLFNRYDSLPIEAVESAEQSDIPEITSSSAPRPLPISEQLKSYARKQKTNFAKRAKPAIPPPPNACLTPLPPASTDTSRVTMPVSEQLKLYTRTHSSKFANRAAVTRDACPTPLSDKSRVGVPVNQQPRSNSASEHGSNIANQSTTPTSASHANPATRRVVCVSDSMTRSIRNTFINQKLQQHSVEGSVHETVHMDLNPGGDTEKINHASKFMLAKYKPNTLIIVAGTNDISYDTKSAMADADVISDRIINIGKEAVRDFKCVEKIAISSIMIRGAAQYSDIVFDVNLRLRLKCIREDFTYIDNECITKHDLYDGLHLNRFGNDKFLHKLLSCCESYNPCLADDLQY